MEIFDEKKQAKLNVTFSGILAELLDQLDINPVTVIVTRNSEVLTNDEFLNNEDKIEILSVVSGG